MFQASAQSNVLWGIKPAAQKELNNVPDDTQASHEAREATRQLQDILRLNSENNNLSQLNTTLVQQNDTLLQQVNCLKDQLSNTEARVVHVEKLLFHSKQSGEVWTTGSPQTRRAPTRPKAKKTGCERQRGRPRRQNFESWNLEKAANALSVFKMDYLWLIQKQALKPSGKVNREWLAHACANGKLDEHETARFFAANSPADFLQVLNTIDYNRQKAIHVYIQRVDARQKQNAKRDYKHMMVLVLWRRTRAFRETTDTVTKDARKAVDSSLECQMFEDGHMDVFERRRNALPREVANNFMADYQHVQTTDCTPMRVPPEESCSFNCTDLDDEEDSDDNDTDNNSGEGGVNAAGTDLRDVTSVGNAGYSSSSSSSSSSSDESDDETRGAFKKNQGPFDFNQPSWAAGFAKTN
jgi:hypothetical protein